jgi:endonuclease/exonuclease/phosphatase family metal-dependent hydrolase
MALPEQSSTPFLDGAAPLETGFRDAPNSAGPSPSRVVVGSYNIRYGVGHRLISSGVLRKIGINSPRHRTMAVAENIRNAAKAFSSGDVCPPVDILALQEADKSTDRAGGLHVAGELADALKMSWVHAPAGIPRGQAPEKRQWWLDFEEQIGLDDPGDTGVALLSRWPLEELTRIDLPWHECPWRPRLSLGVTVKVGNRSLRIFNSHIDPHSAVGGQLEQVERVLVEAERTNVPVVLLGDFNTLSKRKCLDMRKLLESRGFTTPFPTGTATWRGAGLRLHADWIFVRDLRVTRWGVARPLNVSDHWPIWAEIEL